MGKGKGKGRNKKPISEEKLAEIKEKQEARATEEGRSLEGNATYMGELVKRSKKSGWIKPSNPAKLPAEIKSKIKDMVATRSANAVEHGTEDSIFKGQLIYVRMCDVAPQTKISVGDKLKFKLYTDNEGVGAHDAKTV